MREKCEISKSSVFSPKSANRRDVLYYREVPNETSKHIILVALLHGVSVVDLEMERAVIKSVNVAFDVDPLPCMDILPSLKGQC